MFNKESSPYTKEIASTIGVATRIVAKPAEVFWGQLTRNDGENRGAITVVKERLMSALRTKKREATYRFRTRFR